MSSPDTNSPAAPGPYVITVGRQFGSGGRELGRALAADLGIDYYDKELLVEAANQAGVSPEFFERNDERFPSILHGLFSFNMGAMPQCYFTGPSAISDDGLYKAVSDFLLKTSQEKPFVVVGRTADYILRHHPRVVNLFVHAHIDDCIDRITRRGDSISRQKAEQLARKTNKWRADYYNFFTDKEWGRAESYDLTINSSLLPMPQIVELVKHYMRLRGILP